MKNNDPAHAETEVLISQMESRINNIYKQASEEVKIKCDDYFRRYRKKDEAKRKQLEAGIITKKQYQDWLQGQIAVGKRWVKMRDQLAQDYHNTNVIARSIVEGYMPEVYAINHNFGTYQVENGINIDTSYTLYSRESVENILRENPDLLPSPGKALQERIAAGKDIRWNSQQIQSVMIQGILQGESIPHIAERLRKEVGDSNRKASIRNARTMATTAQNAGRFDAFKRAEGKGVKMKKTWVATLDNRTRHWHRQLDGVTIPNDELFVTEYSELMYPGDRAGDPADLYNCRCTMIAQIEGFERDTASGRTIRQLRDDGKTMTYSEWKAAKDTPRNILHQEQLSENMKKANIDEYRRKTARARKVLENRGKNNRS